MGDVVSLCAYRRARCAGGVRPLALRIDTSLRGIVALAHRGRWHQLELEQAREVADRLLLALQLSALTVDVHGVTITRCAGGVFVRLPGASEVFVQRREALNLAEELARACS